MRLQRLAHFVERTTVSGTQTTSFTVGFGDRECGNARPTKAPSSTDFFDDIAVEGSNQEVSRRAVSARSSKRGAFQLAPLASLRVVRITEIGARRPESRRDDWGRSKSSLAFERQRPRPRPARTSVHLVFALDDRMRTSTAPRLTGSPSARRASAVPVAIV
jgi:hypothetical protein